MTVHESVKAFRTVAGETSMYGSIDTEPDMVFQNCVRCHYLRREYELPSTPDDWDIFGGMEGAEQVAVRLTEALRQVLTAIDRVKPEGQKKLRSYLSDLLWRAPID